MSEIRILGESSIEQIDVPENELKKPVMKKYRIIIELTGDSPSLKPTTLRKPKTTSFLRSPATSCYNF